MVKACLIRLAESYYRRYQDREALFAQAQIRFEERMTVRMKIEPDTIRARVPNLTLQPLVENAIRHGVSQGEEFGHIEIRAKRVNGTLHLQVEDDGPGLTESQRMFNTSAPGLGLANTKARLHNLYGDAFRFELTDASGGGLLVTMEIPFQIMPSDFHQESEEFSL